MNLLEGKEDTLANDWYLLILLGHLRLVEACTIQFQNYLGWWEPSSLPSMDLELYPPVPTSQHWDYRYCAIMSSFHARLMICFCALDLLS